MVVVETPASPRPLLEVTNVTHQFLQRDIGALTACDKVSLTLNQGDALGVVGESGSGKTTLGRILSGLLKPTMGEVHIGDRDVYRLNRSALRALHRDVQIVFQEPAEALNPRMKIGVQTTEVLRAHGLRDKGQLRSRAQELLRTVGLPPDLVDALPSALSIGMQQRVCIARAIAGSPKLVILDEPTSALPPETKTDIMALLSDLQTRFELSYILITHDLALVRDFCQHVAVMYLGQIVELRDCESVFERPAHPYTQMLLDAVLDWNPHDPRRQRQPVGAGGGEPASAVDRPRGCFFAPRCPIAEARCHTERQDLTPAPVGGQVRCWRATEARGLAGESPSAGKDTRDE